MLVEWIEERFGMAIDQFQRQFKPNTPLKKQQQSKQTTSKSSFSLFGVDLSAWTNGGRIERPPKPTATPTERIETIYRDNQSTAEMWRFAHHQLELQFDRATFETYLREVVLVDYDPASLTFTLAAGASAPGRDAPVSSAA